MGMYLPKGWGHLMPTQLEREEKPLSADISHIWRVSGVDFCSKLRDVPQNIENDFRR